MRNNQNKWLANFLSSVLISSSLISCTTSPSVGIDTAAMTGSATVDCEDCELKEAIEAKKGLIKSKEALLRADKQTVQAMKDYNSSLADAIKDYDKKIATLKDSKMQGFKFVLEGALAVLEIESLVGLAKNVKCLKPTAKTPIIVNGVEVAGPKILKFGLALKDPKKFKMFVAKASIKGTLAAANDKDQSWTDMAIGFIPLTSAMKLPQRWDEWINAGDLIAVLEDAKTKVGEQIKANEASIAELEKVIPLTEKRIQTLQEELKKLEDELAAKGGQCSVDSGSDSDVVTVAPTPTTPTLTPTYSYSYYGMTFGSGSGTVVTEEPTGTGSGSGSGTVTPPDDGSGAGSGSASCTADTDYDYVDYDDTTGAEDSSGCGTVTDTDEDIVDVGDASTVPDAGSDNTSFPWGYSF